MKMSAWIRFCLIVLCLAMACSMFACRNPEEQTTEKPEQVTTEAPSVEKPTEQPTEKPTETPTTEAPMTETTEAPATEPTEAPVTETTEAPATETTEAPATETTEAPVTETTEAPATETTEAPATETAEEVTNTYLEEETIVIGGIEYVEEAASPYAYNIDSHGGAPGQTIIATADNFNQVVSGLKGWIAIRPGILKYVYAIVVDGVQGAWIDFTDIMLPDGSNTVGYDRPDVITHIANNFPGFESSIAGTNCGFNFTHTLDLSQYHGKDVSIVYYAVVYKVNSAGDRVLGPDGNGIEGAWIHMATAIDVMPEHYGVGGYRDNGDGTHSIKCEGCNEYYITEACNPAFGSGATAKDTATHTGMTCGLCNQTVVEGPHSAPSNYVWDDEKGIYTTYYNDVVWDAEQGKYISVCIACGGQAGDAFGAVHSVELENLNIGQPSWATSQSNEETYAVITMGEHMQNGSPSGWKAAYFKVNPNALRTGQYVALRYMIPEGSNATTLGYEFIDVNIDVPVIADGEWHIVIVELPGKDASYAIPAGDTRLNFNNTRGWKQGDQICLDWIKTYDSVEALNLDLKIGQEDCACPAWAIEVVEYAGVEAHSVRCTVCGKMDTAPHTPSSTRGVAVEGGYAKICSVCGGVTAEPAMGTYVFDKADLMNGIHSTSLTKEETETGVKFTNPDAGDRNFTLFQNVTGAETGKYLFFKYRADASSVSAFTASDYAEPIWNRNYGLTLDCDGEWHIAVVEMPLVANEDGKYYAQHLRVDVEGSEGAWMELEYIGYADDAAALAGVLKTAEGENAVTYACADGCQAVFNKNVIIDEANHGIKCAICDTTLSTEAHFWTSTDCTTAMPTCACGAEQGTLAHVVAGSNGEYCSACGKFLNVDDISEYFSYIWGGKNAPNATSGAYKGQDAVTGYNVYTTTKTDYRHQLISTDSPISGRYLVVKYLVVDGSMRIGTFPTTKQTGINGSYTYNHDLVSGGWKYIVVDLVASTTNSGVQLSDDGNVYLKHFSVDYDLLSGTTATAQVAYVAIAATLDNAIEGIKAIEGVDESDDFITADNCAHGINGDALSVYVVIGDGSGAMYTMKCALCGAAKAGRTAVTIKDGNWNDQILDNEVVENGKSVGSGWVSVPGGWIEARFTLTNVDNPEETTVVVMPITTLSYDNAKWPAEHGAAEDRRAIGVDLTIADWSNVNGIDFTGKNVKIELKLVLKKDPTAPALTWRIANVWQKNSAVVVVPSVEPVDPATCEHVGSVLATWDEDEQAYISNTACTKCGENYEMIGAMVFTAADMDAHDYNGRIGALTDGYVTFNSANSDIFIWGNVGGAANMYSNYTTSHDSGSIIVIKYKNATKETATIYAAPQGDGWAKGGGQDNYSMTIDMSEGEHYVVVDMSTLGLTRWDGVTTYSIDYIRLDGLGADVEYIAVVHSTDRVPEGVQ